MGGPQGLPMQARAAGASGRSGGEEVPEHPLRLG